MPYELTPQPKAVLSNVARANISFERGEGAFLFDSSGDMYLDFASGVATNAFGHAHPYLVAELTSQAKKLWHTSNLFRISGLERAAERLAGASFADSVFFCNSGAEAIEATIKMVRRFQFAKGHPQRNRIITCHGAFHGRTMAALAATGNKNYLVGFDPIPEGFDHVPFGDIAAMRRAISAQTAGILIEPIQGEGGINVPPPGYLEEVAAIARSAGVVFALDEVQTGFGRTGTLFAHQRHGIVPDILASAKGLGSGFPVGAVLVAGHVAGAMREGSHGTTLGGNPLGMAIVNAVLDLLLAEGFLETVTQKGAYLQARLADLVKKYPGFYTDARGEGLLAGLQCSIPSRGVMEMLIGARLLVAPAADNVIRLLPPLNVSFDEIDMALERLDSLAANVVRQHLQEECPVSASGACSS